MSKNCFDCMHYEVCKDYYEVISNKYDANLKFIELVPCNRHMSNSGAAIVEAEKIAKGLTEWLVDKVRREFGSEEICEAVLAALTINAASNIAETENTKRDA